MRNICLLAAMVFLLGACATEPPAPEFDASVFNGAWNITIPDEPRAWWLKVVGAETPNTTGEMVGPPGGGMYAPDTMAVEGEELVYAFRQRKYSIPGENLPWAERPLRDATYHVSVRGDQLTGYVVVDGHPETRVDFTGDRAPEITDRPDGSWKEGEPVELFNGKDLSGWKPVAPDRGFKWEVKDGVLMNDPPTSDIVSEQKFWNFKLHAEYRLYERSNSGIALRDRYEVQISENYGKDPHKQGHGAIYYRITPTSNPSKPIGEWQTMDVTLIGRYVTVVLNGETIIDQQIIEGPTAMGHDPNEAEPGPISVQGDHTRVDIRKFTVTPLTK
jgi:hypothetical protein